MSLLFFSPVCPATTHLFESIDLETTPQEKKHQNENTQEYRVSKERAESSDAVAWAWLLHKLKGRILGTSMLPHVGVHVSERRALA